MKLFKKFDISRTDKGIEFLISISAGFFAYLICSIAGILLLYDDYAISMITPAAALAIYLTYSRGLMVLPGIFIASLFINNYLFSGYLDSNVSIIAMSLLLSSVNIFVAFTGAKFLQNKVIINRGNLFSLYHINRFVFYVVCFPALIQAILGTTILTAFIISPENHQILHVKFFSWFLSDSTAYLVFIPFLFSWKANPVSQTNIPTRIEMILLVFSLLLLPLLIIISTFPIYLFIIALTYTLTPLYLWLALRFNSRFVTSILLCTFFYFCFLILYISNEMIRDFTGTPLTLIQAFLFILGLLVVIVHSIINERNKSLQDVSESEKSLRHILSGIPVPIIQISENEKIDFVNEEFTRVTGYHPDDIKTSADLYKKAFPVPDIRDKFLKEFQLIKNSLNSEMEHEFTIRTSSGAYRDIALRLSATNGKDIHVMIDVTHKKKMLEKIRENERRMATLIGNLQGMVYRCRLDKNWTMDFVSEGTYKLTGYLPSELVHNRITSYNDIIIERFRDYVWDSINKSIMKGKSFTLQYQIKTKDGLLKWVSERGSGVFNKDGTCKWVEGFIYDITKRVQTLESLRKSEEKYRLLIENQTDIIVKTDLSGTLHFISSNYFSLSGKTKEELINQKFDPEIHPSDRKFGKNELDLLKVHPYSCNLEQRIKTINGWRWYIWNIKAEQNKHKKIKSIISIGRDITERKIAEERLIESQERYTLATNAANAGIWDWDIKLNEVYFSPKWKEQLGHSDHEIPNDFNEWTKRLHPDDNIRMVNAVQSYLDNPLPFFEEEFRLKHKNGTYRWIHNRAQGLLDQNGKVYRMFGAHYDITDRKKAENKLKKAEKEIRELNKQLELRVKKRTQELERINQELEAFSYSVSHDLKAPLRAIKGFSSLFLEEHGNKLKSGALHYMNNILRNAENMTNLINHLLHFSRLGRKSMIIIPVDTNLIVNSIIEDLKKANNKHYSFIIGELPVINADETLIRQVFENILSNAFKFSSLRKDPEIRIEYSQNTEKHIFSVSDNGIGFNQKLAGKIFKVFQRVHSQEEFEGTGIGLALVQRIVHRHGGEIWVHSEEEKGAIFFFSLPFIIESEGK